MLTKKAASADKITSKKMADGNKKPRFIARGKLLNDMVWGVVKARY
jgi:hypothetical protein